MESLRNNSIINWELYHKIYGDKEMKIETEIKKFDFKESDNIYIDIMNDEIASDIKKWRVTEEYSWRAVHREFQYKYIPEEKWFEKMVQIAKAQILTQYPDNIIDQLDIAYCDTLEVAILT